MYCKQSTFFPFLQTCGGEKGTLPRTCVNHTQGPCSVQGVQIFPRKTHFERVAQGQLLLLSFSANLFYMLRAIFLQYYHNVLYYKYVLRPRIILSVMAKRKRIRIETSPCSAFKQQITKKNACKQSQTKCKNCACRLCINTRTWVEIQYVCLLSINIALKLYILLSQDKYSTMDG